MDLHFKATIFRNSWITVESVNAASTALWLQANAQAENFMKLLNQAIKSVTVKGKSLERKMQEMHKFPRSYRATPYSNTWKPPGTFASCCLQSDWLKMMKKYSHAIKTKIIPKYPEVGFPVDHDSPSTTTTLADDPQVYAESPEPPAKNVQLNVKFDL